MIAVSHILVVFIVSGGKDSANRAKNQIYLSFSEMQPIFGHDARAVMES